MLNFRAKLSLYHFVIFTVLFGSGSFAWQFSLDQESQGRINAFEIDSHGDIFAVGITEFENVELPSGQYFLRYCITARKISGLTGKVIWLHEICPGPDERASSYLVRVAPDGNPIVAGSSSKEYSTPQVYVVKLASDSGRELWRTVTGYEDPSGTNGVGLFSATGLGIDSKANVLVQGNSTLPGVNRYGVMKLSGNSGEVLWTNTANVRDIPPFLGWTEPPQDYSNQVAADPQDQVIGRGRSIPNYNSIRLLVEKLSALDGKALWRTLIGRQNSSIYASEFALNNGGDVFVCGVGVNPGTDGYHYDQTVIKILGSTGEPVWRQDIDVGINVSNGSCDSLALDHTGDVLTGGTISFATLKKAAFTVIKLASSDGSELWRTLIYGTMEPTEDTFVSSGARSVVTTRTGDAIAAGYTRNLDSREDVTIVRLAGDSGEEKWRSFPFSSQPTNCTNYALDLRKIQLDHDENAVILGYGRLCGKESNFILKINGSDGSDFVPDPLLVLPSLFQEVQTLKLPKRIDQNLMAKLLATERMLENISPEDKGRAAGPLNAFVNAVDAQRGKAISASDADKLVADANYIISLLD